MSDPSFSNIDQWLFELEEGNLTPAQVAKLEAFLIRHPELDVDLDMWRLAKVDGELLPYPRKEELERRKPVALYWDLAAAASILLLIGAGFFGYFSTTDTHTIASQTSMATTAKSTTQQTSSNQLESDEFSTHSTYSKLTALNNHFPTAQTMLGNHTTHTAQAVQQTGSDHVTQSGVHQNTGKHVTLLALNDVADEEFTTLTANYSGRNRNAASRRSNGQSSVKHRHSFEYRFKQFKRTIRRMVDNPIALKNLKDPQYHVPGMQSTDINFSSVGTMLATRVQVASRYQWMGQQNEQLMNQLLIDGYSFALRGGIGLQVYQSNYHRNGISDTYAAVTYSPKFSVSKNVTVEPGIRYKMGYTSVSANRLNPGEDVEFERGNARQYSEEGALPRGKALWYQDMGFSTLINTKWFYTGFQFDNLFRHFNNIYDSPGTERAPIHTILTLGTDYESKSENLGFSPYVVYQHYGNLDELWGGANFRVHWLTFGGGVSSKLEPSASLGVRFKHFALSYTADYTQSALSQQNELSHQLTIRFLTNPSRVGQRLLNL